MSVLLRSWNQEVQAASDGTAALAAVQTAKPDMVLMDIGLPGMDGYEIAKRLRQEPHGRDICLVALTGYGRQEDRDRAIKAGFDFHLTKKPISTEKLRELLRKKPPILCVRHI